MSKLPISVVLTHYNRPQLLAEALESIQSQTCPPDEIIVVDDCSTSELRRQLFRFKNVSRIYYNPINLGLSASRNIGVHIARNPWVAFLDDDDLYHPKKLELQSAYLERHPECEILGGPLLRVKPDGDTQIWGYREQRRLDLRDGLRTTASSLCTMLIRKSTWIDAGGMDYRFRQLGDLEFGIRLLAAGCRMEILPEPLVTYRLGGRQQMSLHWEKTWKAHFRVIHKHSALYRKEFGPLGAAQEYARRARFYGLRKGGVPGRSMWAAGCIGQLMFGGIPEPEIRKAQTAPVLFATTRR